MLQSSIYSEPPITNRPLACPEISFRMDSERISDRRGERPESGRISLFQLRWMSPAHLDTATRSSLSSEETPDKPGAELHWPRPPVARFVRRVGQTCCPEISDEMLQHRTKHLDNGIKNMSLGHQDSLRPSQVDRRESRRVAGGLCPN